MLRPPFAIGPVSVTSFESASVLIMASLPKIVKCRPDQRLQTFFNIQAFRQSWFCHQRLFRKRTLTPKVETYCFGQEMPKGSSFPNLLFQDPSHSPSVFVLFIFNPEKEPSFSSRENKDIAEESSRVKVVVSSALQTKFSHITGSFDWIVLPIWLQQEVLQQEWKVTLRKGTLVSRRKERSLKYIHYLQRSSWCYDKIIQLRKFGPKSLCLEPRRGNLIPGSQRLLQNREKESPLLLFHFVWLCQKLDGYFHL